MIDQRYLKWKRLDLSKKRWKDWQKIKDTNIKYWK